MFVPQCHLLDKAEDLRRLEDESFWAATGVGPFTKKLDCRGRKTSFESLTSPALLNFQ